MKKSFLNKIDESIKNSILEGDEATIDSYITSKGYNVDEINELAEKQSKKLTFLMKGVINETKNDNLLERASAFFEDAITKNLDKPISYLKSLVLSNNLQVQHRNLENLTLDEIKNIIKDQNLLELLEDLDEE